MDNLGEFFENMLDMDESAIKTIDEFKIFIKVFIAIFGTLNSIIWMVFGGINEHSYFWMYFITISAIVISLVYMYGKKSVQEKIDEIFNLKKVIKDQSLTIIELVDKLKGLGGKPELRRIEPKDV